MDMSSGRIMPTSFVHTSFNFSIRRLSGASSKCYCHAFSKEQILEMKSPGKRTSTFGKFWILGNPGMFLVYSLLTFIAAPVLL